MEECLRPPLRRMALELSNNVLKRQFGFQHGVSIYSAQNKLKELIERMAKQLIEQGSNDNPVILFVDIKDAYGSVNMNKLFSIIEDMQFWSREEIQLYRFIYSFSSFKLGTSLGCTTRGLPQGSKLSCELFIIYFGVALR